jgi:hypothetical protein
MSKIIKATLDSQNQVHYQGPPPLDGNYKVLIAILDQPEEEAIYSALTPRQLEQLNSKQLIQIIQSLANQVTISSPRQPGLLKGQLGKAFFDPLQEEELSAWGL